MAFKDITKVLYDGKIKLDYKDKAHRYYARTRINWDLSPDDPKAWSKVIYPKGTTTLLGDTLEKKGLMQWPKGLAIRELFGFYDFKNDNGDQMTGFSKGVGTLWEDGKLKPLTQEESIAIIKSANDAWQRKQKKGADIGSVVHDAIEHFIKGEEFDIAENYNWTIKESAFETEELRDKAWEEAPLEVEMAKTAFLQFQKWWMTATPTLHSAEDILYSLEYNVCGTYDGDLSIKREYHPKPELFEKEELRITADWKTSNASASKEAAAPEGVYYSYFIQLAIYELMRREMGFPPADDLLTVSARKDGGFSLIYASELDLTVEECIDWAKAVILCYRLADKSKGKLLAHAEPQIDPTKEEF